MCALTRSAPLPTAQCLLLPSPSGRHRPSHPYPPPTPPCHPSLPPGGAAERPRVLRARPSRAARAARRLRAVPAAAPPGGRDRLRRRALRAVRGGRPTRHRAPLLRRPRPFPVQPDQLEDTVLLQGHVGAEGGGSSPIPLRISRGDTTYLF